MIIHQQVLDLHMICLALLSWRVSWAVNSALLSSCNPPSKGIRKFLQLGQLRNQLNCQLPDHQTYVSWCQTKKNKKKKDWSQGRELHTGQLRLQGTCVKRFQKNSKKVWPRHEESLRSNRYSKTCRQVSHTIRNQSQISSELATSTQIRGGDCCDGVCRRVKRSWEKTLLRNSAFFFQFLSIDFVDCMETTSKSAGYLTANCQKQIKFISDFISVYTIDTVKSWQTKPGTLENISVSQSPGTFRQLF